MRKQSAVQSGGRLMQGWQVHVLPGPTPNVCASERPELETGEGETCCMRV